MLQRSGFRAFRASRSLQALQDVLYCLLYFSRVARQAYCHRLGGIGYSDGGVSLRMVVLDPLMYLRSLPDVPYELR